MMAIEIDPNAQTRGDLSYKIAVTILIEINHPLVTHEGHKKPHEIPWHRAHALHRDDCAIKPHTRSLLGTQMQV